MTRMLVKGLPYLIIHVFWLYMTIYIHVPEMPKHVKHKNVLLASTSDMTNRRHIATYTGTNDGCENDFDVLLL